MKCVDMHVHLGASKDGARLGQAEIRKFLDDLPISHMVVFPVDETGAGSYQKLNDQVAALAAKDKRVIGFCRLNASRPQAALQELERSVKLGLRGVKLHPRAEAFSPNQAALLMPEIEKKKLPVILHTSHEPDCRPRDWAPLFLKYKKIFFILAHAGKDLYREAAMLASRFSNVYLDTATLSYYRTSFLFQNAGARKLVFASDAPYSHPALELLKWDLVLRKDSLARRQIFEENPKKILGGF